MLPLKCLLLPLLLAMVLVSAAQADFLIYRLPGTGATGAQGQQQDSSLRIVLQGRVTVNAGRTVTFVHTALRQPLYFGLDTVEIMRVPTTQQEFNRKAGLVAKDADKLFALAVWGLKKGLLKDYRLTVAKVLELNPEHVAARRVTEIMKEIDKPLPESTAAETEIKKVVKRKNMRIAKSKHFVLLHDTPAKPAEGRRKNRADERLELLEQVYESFLLLFYSQDVELDIPRERMKVVLFNDKKDYLDFATDLSPSLSSAAGFWSPDLNVSFFFDHATDGTFIALEKLQKQLQLTSDEAKKNRTANAKDIVRFTNTLNLLIEAAQENADIEVVSHEATHQLAGNTGLFPRYVAIPSWVHEGLATYFESPGDATWSGIGAVNAQRLEWYKALQNDREHSSIEFIVGDQIFDYARTIGGKLHGYGQAWALTHFLMENHLKDFVAYYRMLGEMPPDVTLSSELLTELFDKTFPDRTQLEQEWRAFMRTLKTDMDKVEEANAKN